MSINRITQDQLNNFFTEGYIKIEQIVPAPLMQKLRSYFDEIINDVYISADKVIHANGNTVFVTNVDKLCYKKNLACLELLGNPFLLEIAEAICGEDFFPIQEFALIKHLGDGLPVLWHQDMVHERKGNCFTVGIYLDDADSNEGALRIIPKSHLSNKDICVLNKEPFIEVPMKAGDILVHDMMLAHSSGLLSQNKLRRVIYFEFLSAKHVFAENIYSKELVDNRTAILKIALEYHQQICPNDIQFEWKNKQDFAFSSGATIEAKLDYIYKMPINARPSAYCFNDFK